MTTVVDRPAAPRLPESAHDAGPQHSLRAHALGLLLVLLALLPLIGSDSVFSADEGAAMLQADLLDRTGQWSEANPFPAVDPDAERFGVHLSHQLEDGTFTHFGRRPVYAVALLATTAIGSGLFGALVLSILGTVAAATAAGRLIRHLRPNLDWVALWVTGLLSPLVFNSYWVIAHALAAGCIGWALVHVLGRPGSAPTKTQLVAGGLLLALAAMIRTEAGLFAIALALALLVVDKVLDPNRSFRFVVPAAATAGAMVLNSFLVTTLIGTTVGGSIGIGEVPRYGWLDGRIEGFKATVLRGSIGGSQPIDLLLVVGIVAAIVGVSLHRSSPTNKAFGRLAIVGAALFIARFALGRDNVIPGLMVAFPLLPIGLVALQRKHLRPPVARILGIATLLFAGAVVATQYSQGGTAEFGGRYFAIMLPAIVPLLVVALADIGAKAPTEARTAWRVGLGLMAATTVAMGLFGLHGSKVRTEQLVDAERGAIAQVVAETGEPAVVLSTFNAVSRWSWDLYDDSRWLIVDIPELAEVAGRLEANGIEHFVVVGNGIDADETMVLDGYTRRARTMAWTGSRWSVSLYDLTDTGAQG